MGHATNAASCLAFLQQQKPDVFTAVILFLPYPKNHLSYDNQKLKANQHKSFLYLPE